MQHQEKNAKSLMFKAKANENFLSSRLNSLNIRPRPRTWNTKIVTKETVNGPRPWQCFHPRTTHEFPRLDQIFRRWQQS